jgi:hypothetical protein
VADNYEAILQAIQKLSPADRSRLLSDLADKAPSRSGEKVRAQSLLKLRGLGAEIWANIDPDEYVDQERSSWNG